MRKGGLLAVIKSYSNWDFRKLENKEWYVDYFTDFYKTCSFDREYIDDILQDLKNYNRCNVLNCSEDDYTKIKDMLQVIIDDDVSYSINKEIDDGSFDEYFDNITEEIKIEKPNNNVLTFKDYKFLDDNNMFLYEDSVLKTIFEQFRENVYIDTLAKSLDNVPLIGVYDNNGLIVEYEYDEVLNDFKRIKNKEDFFKYMKKYVKDAMGVNDFTITKDEIKNMLTKEYTDELKI